MMDQDIEFMSRDKLKQEIIKLRAAIRLHRDNATNLPPLWLLLPEKVIPTTPLEVEQQNETTIIEEHNLDDSKRNLWEKIKDWLKSSFKRTNKSI